MEMDWQPIETAPDDGSWMLLHITTGRNDVYGNVIVARRNDNIHADWDEGGTGPYFEAPLSDGFMREVFDETGGKPTHWMPLPASPQT